MPNKSEFALVMAKHLPPSASDLRLLDVGGVVGEDIKHRRPDVELITASLDITHWDYPSQFIDAVVAYDMLLKPDMLTAILDVMRAGGRFIMVNPLGQVDEQWVKTLEQSGYVRILVEPAIQGEGVLIRGERIHTTDDTLQRVHQTAERDENLLDLANYRGRYIHLLIQQKPNKPVWKMTPDEEVHWHTATIQRDNQQTLLAFSSLPKAVNFMQPAVLEGIVNDVNKVGKFSLQTAETWTMPVLLNPTLGSIRNYPIQWVDIDPKTAEAPDE